MTNKRQHKKTEEQRLEKLSTAGRLVNGIVLPEGAIAADLAQQRPTIVFAAAVLRRPLIHLHQLWFAGEVWTAEQQQWYYEVA